MTMEFVTRINETLRPTPNASPVVVDLFAGCGGLAIRFQAAGFETIGFEIDAMCCATYRRNLVGNCNQVRLAPDN